jgi:hypothetical protein
MEQNNIPTSPQVFGSAAPQQQASVQNTPAAATSNNYESNPFYTNVNGLITLLKTNTKSALLGSFWTLCVIILSYLLVLIPFLGIVLFFIALFFVFPIFGGAFFALAASSLNNEKMEFGEALSRSLKKYVRMIGLGLLMIITLLIGFLLLIIPGFYLLGRLSLSGLLIFTENLGPIAAMKRSFKLTKGHVIEQLGLLFANSFLNGGSAGLLTMPLSVAPLAERYKDLVDLEKSGASAPKTHWMNHLLVFGTLAFFVVVFGLAFAFGAFTQNKLEQFENTNSSSQFESESFNDSLNNDSYDTPFDSSPEFDSQIYTQ